MPGTTVSAGIEGIVLAAGRSERAGVFKPAYRHEGRALLAHAVDGLVDWCARVIVVGGHRHLELAEVLVEAALESPFRPHLLSPPEGAPEFLGPAGLAALSGATGNNGADEPAGSGESGETSAPADLAASLHPDGAAPATVPNVVLVINPDHDAGMFTSVQTGARALTPGVRGILVQPVDCPLVDPDVYQALLAAFDREGGRRAAVPVHEGRGGHPVLLPGQAGESIVAAGSGTTLRDVVRAHDPVRVPVDSPSVLMDLDTPADLADLVRFTGRNGRGRLADARRLEGRG